MVQIIYSPRYLAKPEALAEKATNLGEYILGKTGQGSFTVVTDTTTYFHSIREQDKND